MERLGKKQHPYIKSTTWFPKERRFAVGDRLMWTRHGDEDVYECKVRAVSEDGTHCQLEVTGWVGLHWERITGIEFRLARPEEVWRKPRAMQR